MCIYYNVVFAWWGSVCAGGGGGVAVDPLPADGHAEEEELPPWSTTVLHPGQSATAGHHRQTYCRGNSFHFPPFFCCPGACIGGPFSPLLGFYSTFDYRIPFYTWSVTPLSANCGPSCLT